MKHSDPISQYIALLQIRQKARRRDVRISGVVFSISLLATISLGLLGRPEAMESYILMLGFLIAFLLSFLMSWTRLELLKSTLEFAECVQREVSRSS